MKFSLNKYLFFIYFYLMSFNVLLIITIPLDNDNIDSHNNDKDSFSDINSMELSTTTQSSLMVDINNSGIITESNINGNCLKYYFFLN